MARPGRRRLIHALALAAAALAGAPAGAAAQRAAASPALARDGWVVAALRRLDGLGLGGGGLDPGAALLTREEALRRMAGAAAQARDPDVARLAAGYAARLLNELGPATGAAGPRLEIGASVGYADRRGAILTGYDRNGLTYPAAPLGAASRPGAGVEVDALLSRGLAAVVSSSTRGDAPRLQEAYAAATVGVLRVWAGRRDAAFGAEEDRSIVLGGAAALDGGGLSLDSLRLPGPLAAVGPVRLEVFAARLHESGAVAHPGFLAARVWARPHPRLWLAATRAASFDGRGNRSLRVGEIPGFLVGLAGGVHGETENQVASLEARWRPPAAGLPLVLYGEWAFDDLGFAWTHVPGVTAGMELPALPWLPAASVGLERTSFSGHCCGNPPWYRHSALPWIDQRVPLGHPLGGQGLQWLAYGHLSLPPGLELAIRAFHRWRGPENLFAPLRQGVSNGADLDVEWLLRPGVVAFGNAGIERGDGWRESTLRSGIRVRGTLFSPGRSEARAARERDRARE